MLSVRPEKRSEETRGPMEKRKKTAWHEMVWRAQKPGSAAARTEAMPLALRHPGGILNAFAEMIHKRSGNGKDGNKKFVEESTAIHDLVQRRGG